MNRCWFKILPDVHPTFRATAEKDFNIVQGFLRLFEAAVFFDSSVKANDDGRKITKTVATIYKQSNRHFDVDYVAANREFVLDNLTNLINIDKSVAFVESIKRLPGECRIVSYLRILFVPNNDVLS